MLKIALFGELLIDHKTINDQKILPTPGGSSYFISSCFTKHKYQLIILAHCGKDFPDKWISQSIKLLPSKQTQKYNPSYFLKYFGNQRKLHINKPSYFLPVIPQELSNSKLKDLATTKLAFFCSTAPIYTPRIIISWKKYLPKAKIILLGQGWMRKFNKTKVIPQSKTVLIKWFNQIKSSVDFVVFSDKDHNSKVEEAIIKLMSSSVVIVKTQAKKGAVIYFKNKMINVPTKWPIEENKTSSVDFTGAGDRWAGIFSSCYFIDRLPLYQAGQKAHQVTSFIITHLKTADFKLKKLL